MPAPNRSKELRKGRHSTQNGIYLITVVALRRERLFTDWYLAAAIINALKEAEGDGDAISLCWVVMPDHLHWLIELKSADLAKVVARMKSRSTVHFNRQTGRIGSLWQKGYHDRAIRHEVQIKTVARYVIANPVRAGLVDKVGDYPMWDAVWL